MAYDAVMSDVDGFEEEDITRWAEDHGPQSLIGEDADEDFGGEAHDGDTV